MAQVKTILIGGPYDGEEESVREDQMTVVRHNAAGGRDVYIRFARTKVTSDQLGGRVTTRLFFVHSTFVERGSNFVHVQLTARDF